MATTPTFVVFWRSKFVTLFFLSFLLAPWVTKGENMPPLPPGVEIVSPKELGLSEEEIDKFLGKVSSMNGNNAKGPKTQILTVGFDANEKINLDQFQTHPEGLSAADKLVTEIAVKGLENRNQNKFGDKLKQHTPNFGNILVVPTRLPLTTKATSPESRQKRPKTEPETKPVPSESRQKWPQVEPQPKPAKNSNRETHPKTKSTGEAFLENVNRELNRQILETMKNHEQQITELQTKQQKIIPVKKPKDDEKDRLKGQPSEPAKSQLLPEGKTKIQHSAEGKTKTQNSQEGKTKTLKTTENNTGTLEVFPATTVPVLPAVPPKGKYPQVPVSVSPKPFPEKIEILNVATEPGKPPAHIVLTSTGQPQKLDSAQQNQILGDVQQQGPILFTNQPNGTIVAVEAHSQQVFPPPQSHQHVQFMPGPIFVQHQHQHPFHQVMVHQQPQPPQMMYPPQQFFVQQEQPQQFPVYPQGAQFPGQGQPPPQQFLFAPQGQQGQIQGQVGHQYLGEVPPQSVAYQGQPQPFPGQTQQQPIEYQQVQLQRPQEFQGQPQQVFQGQPPQEFQGQPQIGQPPQVFEGQPQPAQVFQVQPPQEFQGQQMQAFQGQRPQEFQGQPPQVFQGQPPQEFQSQQPFPGQHQAMQEFQQYPGRQPPQHQQTDQIQYVQVHHHQEVQAPEQHYFQQPHPQPQPQPQQYFPQASPSPSPPPFYPSPQPPPQQYYRQSLPFPSPPPTQAEVIYGQPQGHASPAYTTREIYSLPPQTVTYSTPGQGQADMRGQIDTRGQLDMRGQPMYAPAFASSSNPEIVGDQREMNYREAMKYLHQSPQNSIFESSHDSRQKPYVPNPTPSFFESDYFLRQFQQEKERERDSVALRSSYSFGSSKAAQPEYSFFKPQTDTGFKFPEPLSEGSNRPVTFFGTTQRPYDLTPSIPMVKISSPENVVRSADFKAQSSYLRPTLQSLYDQSRSESTAVPVALGNRGTHYNKNLDPLFSNGNLKSLAAQAFRHSGSVA